MNRKPTDSVKDRTVTALIWGWLAVATIAAVAIAAALIGA